jgi:hypothetical protein
MALLAALIAAPIAGAVAQLDGQLELSAVDRDTSKPIAVRVHLRNTKTDKPVKVPGAVALGDYFVFYDRVKLKLPLGSYKFVIERGPEYLVRTGHFTLERYADDRKTVDMKRFVDMEAEHWYAGDLDVRRSPRDIELLMQAEDLYVASLIASRHEKNEIAKNKTVKKQLRDNPPQDRNVVIFDNQRFYSLLAGEYAHGGNSLLLHNLSRPLDLPAADANDPSSLATATAAKDAGGWIDAAQPFAWDLPLWVAAGKLDSIQIAHRHLMRDSVVNHEAGGRPRDLAMYPGTNGAGRWSSDIYYHLLNCGLRIPPTAGSGSGWLPTTTAAPGTAAALKAAASGNFNPVGYNRVYAYVEHEFSWDKWWDSLRAGRAIVTNGPLIRPSVEGQPPGHVFQANRGESIELEIGLTLSTRDKVSYLEIVKDGVTEHEVRLDKWKAGGGKLPPVRFTESGWFLVRAVTDEPSTYRYATTAPYYVEIGYQPRISRASAQFFLDWCRERAKQIADPMHPAGKFSDEKTRTEALNQWQRAELYWQDLLKRSTAP